MSKVEMSKNVHEKAIHFGWDIDKILETPDIVNATNVTITDADLYRVFVIIDGERAEIDVDGGVEYMDK